MKRWSIWSLSKNVDLLFHRDSTNSRKKKWKNCLNFFLLLVEDTSFQHFQISRIWEYELIGLRPGLWVYNWGSPLHVSRQRNYQKSWWVIRTLPLKHPINLLVLAQGKCSNIPFGLIWLIVNIVYPVLKWGLPGDLPHYPTTGHPYNFSGTAFITEVVSYYSRVNDWNH